MQREYSGSRQRLHSRVRVGLNSPLKSIADDRRHDHSLHMRTLCRSISTSPASDLQVLFRCRAVRVVHAACV